MRIKLLRNLGREYPPYRLDEVVDADDKLAQHLVARGLAEVVKGVPKQPAIRGVPPKPAEGTVEKATADLEDYRKRPRRETKTDNPAPADK